MSGYREQHLEMEEKLKEAQETTDFTNKQRKGQLKTLQAQIEELEKAKQLMQTKYEATLATEKGKLEKALDDANTWRKRKETAERDLFEIRSQRSILSDQAEEAKADFENQIKHLNKMLTESQSKIDHFDERMQMKEQKYLEKLKIS